MAESLYIVIISPIVAFILYLIYDWKIKPSLSEKSKMKEEHIDEIIKILKEVLGNATIVYKPFGIEISEREIGVSTKFKNKIGLVLQHLKKNYIIVDNWLKLPDLVRGINDDFGELGKYVSHKMKIEKIEDYKKELFDTTGDITNKIVQSDSVSKIEPDELIIKSEVFGFSVSFRGERAWRLHLQNIKGDKIKEFISNVINNDDYQGKLRALKEKIEPMKKEFFNFRRPLERLLSLSDTKLKRELRRKKCDDCKFFNKNK